MQCFFRSNIVFSSLGGDNMSQFGALFKRHFTATKCICKCQFHFYMLQFSVNREQVLPKDVTPVAFGMVPITNIIHDM